MAFSLKDRAEQIIKLCSGTAHDARDRGVLYGGVGSPSPISGQGRTPKSCMVALWSIPKPTRLPLWAYQRSWSRLILPSVPKSRRPWQMVCGGAMAAALDLIEEVL